MVRFYEFDIFSNSQKWPNFNSFVEITHKIAK